MAKARVPEVGWPIRWSRSIRQNIWLEKLATGAEKRLQSYRRPPHKNLHYLCFRQRSLDIELAASDLAKILDANLLIARRDWYCAGRTSALSGCQLARWFINTHPAALDIRFQRFGINKAVFHIARFVIKARIAIPPVALKLMSPCSKFSPDRPVRL